MFTYGETAQAARRVDRAWMAGLTFGAVSLIIALRLVISLPRQDVGSMAGVADGVLTLLLAWGVASRIVAAGATLVLLAAAGLALHAWIGSPLWVLGVQSIALALYASGLHGLLVLHRAKMAGMVEPIEVPEPSTDPPVVPPTN